ncbi:MAG: hypothetical protein M1422_02450 [Candidatus Thermoplasmatota archaeon]|jgi:hypothetical protein|nr:hypothetical protein [Candidatus Thermoplasmatota archaeon]
MKGKRTNHGYVKAKMHGGGANHGTLGLHFEKRDEEAVKLMKALLSAILSGQKVDVTIYKGSPLKNGKIRITVTTAD